MYGSKLITAFTVGTVTALTVGSAYVGWRYGRADVAQMQAQHEQTTRAAVQAALELERANHERVAQATRQSSRRQDAAAAGFAAANDELRLLNDAALAYARDAESAALAYQLRADMFYDLFGRCTAEFVSMAQKADRADNAARTLIEAWPR